MRLLWRVGKKTENDPIGQIIEVCAMELKRWGERLIKDFKHRLQKCRDKMDRVRGLRDPFSIWCLGEAEAKAKYSKILAQ